MVALNKKHPQSSKQPFAWPITISHEHQEINKTNLTPKEHLIDSGWGPEQQEESRKKRAVY